MKYIDADKLIAEIKRYKNEADERLEIRVRTCAEELKDLALQNLCGNLLNFIDSLQQEQPDVDFKVKERKWVHDAVDNVFPEDGDFMSEFDFRKIIKDTARHFYELGLKARKEK